VPTKKKDDVTLQLKKRDKEMVFGEETISTWEPRHEKM
jgi:hypothetical protein